MVSGQVDTVPPDSHGVFSWLCSRPAFQVESFESQMLYTAECFLPFEGLGGTVGMVVSLWKPVQRQWREGSVTQCLMFPQFCR